MTSFSRKIQLPAKASQTRPPFGTAITMLVLAVLVLQSMPTIKIEGVLTSEWVTIPFLWVILFLRCFS
jgi:hypothetical protein